MVDFGWMLPTGNQRMPSGDYLAHLRRVLDAISGTFHSFWIPDHFMGGAAPIPEALTTLSYLAPLFPELHFGTCVLGQSYRNPALLAKTAATLQSLSDGRFMLGIGAGWKEDEYRAYGYEFPSASTRIAQMSEAVQICKALWTANGVPVTFNGQHYQLSDALCIPEPSPPPPVMIGGMGEKLTLRVVAEHADWWNIPGAPLDVLRHKSEVLARHCDDVGRDPASIRRTWMGVVSIADTETEAKAQLEGFPIWDGDMPLVGTSEQVRKRVAAYVEAGITLFILSFVDEPNLRGIEQFMATVVN
jgi:alkanesulfonate monooxygenase SsuD/methylene tetrahydromethanopterin reductase-like flavin-dependent oxidoreductase (luciferase family)